MTALIPPHSPFDWTLIAVVLCAIAVLFVIFALRELQVRIDKLERRK